MLHYETGYPATLGLLKDLMALPELSKFNLVGGTALALQIGHRISVDLDLFGQSGPLHADSIRKTLTELGDVEDLHEYLGLIRSEAFRCKSITNGLLDFSRMRTGNRFPIDISQILSSSARLITHQKRGNNIGINFEIDADLPPVNADEGQLQQAVIALATNGIDAMPNGGTLTFRAFEQSGRVVVEVQDSGHGIAPENMSKIFEPFFTTKEVGKGTGLGLAVCYGIVTEHNGRLSVRSNIGIGTTFSIFLPVNSQTS